MAEPSSYYDLTNSVNKSQLHLWCAYPDDAFSVKSAQACEDMLSEDEHARLQTFRFDRHRREYLVTRALVRTALSHYHSLTPEAWSFPRNAYGKPAAAPASGLHFNLSNSPSLVVCLIHQGTELGVDVEPHKRAVEIAELAPDVFSPPELAQLQVLRGQDKLDRALSLWTLKESYIKARGLGLSLPLDKFSFLFGGADGICLKLDPCLGDEPGRWRFCLLDHFGHRIALMIEAIATPYLQIWEALPLLASPTKIDAEQKQWFPIL
jgi:4'-phosphopantetheinyl transferase